MGAGTIAVPNKRLVGIGMLHVSVVFSYGVASHSTAQSTQARRRVQDAVKTTQTGTPCHFCTYICVAMKFSAK